VRDYQCWSREMLGLKLRQLCFEFCADPGARTHIGRCRTRQHGEHQLCSSQYWGREMLGLQRHRSSRRSHHDIFCDSCFGGRTHLGRQSHFRRVLSYVCLAHCRHSEVLGQQRQLPIRCTECWPENHHLPHPCLQSFWGNRYLSWSFAHMRTP
jgi:hypothetical protein